MVGKSASDEFVDELVTLAKRSDTRIAVDRTIAYAFGAKFAVEMDIVLPRIMSFEDAHDVGVALQQEFERMPDVARATVHVSRPCFGRIYIFHLTPNKCSLFDFVG